MKVTGKKIVMMMLLAATSFHIAAQQKGLFVTLSGGFGDQGFNYKLKNATIDGTSLLEPGWNAGVGVQYFFTRSLGIEAGLRVSHYQSRGIYKDTFSFENHFSLGSQTDNDYKGHPTDYQLRVRLGNGFAEVQKAYFFDIPIMLVYQYGFGQLKKHGLYVGAGVKVQIPVSSSYTVVDSKYEENPIVNVSGFYPEIANQTNEELAYMADLGAVNNIDLIRHGFGKLYNPNEVLSWNGKISLKPSASLAFKAGFFFQVSKRVDLLLGGYFDYGLNNIKKSATDQTLLNAPDAYLPAAESQIGQGITYNGMLNANVVPKANLMAYGGEIGIRIKIGKIDETIPDDYQPNWAKAQTTVDSIFDRFENYFRKNDSTQTAILGALNRIEASLDKMAEIQQQLAQLQGRVLDNQEKTLQQAYEKPTATASISPKAKEILSPAEQKTASFRIFFKLNSAELTAAAKSTLDDLATVLRNHPELNCRVIGNTCDLGDEKSGNINMVLGLKRAEATRAYLYNKGVEMRRLSISTHASFDPLLPNTNESNRSQNRRCEFSIFTGLNTDYF